MMTTKEEAHKALTWYQNHREKDFFKRRSLWEILELICQESTAHGVGHVWNNRKNALGVMWLLVTSALLIFLTYVVHGLVVDFASREIESQTTVKLPEDRGLQLPSAMLCNRGFFSRGKLRALNITTRLTNYLVGITGSAFLLRGDLLTTEEGLSFLKESHKELEGVLSQRNLTFNELIDALSYSCEELVLVCSVAGRSLPGVECCKYFVAMPSFTGKCYSLYSSPTYTQTIKGEYLGVTLYLSLPYQDFPELDASLLDLSQMVKLGVQLSLTNNLTHPSSSMLAQGLVLLPAVYTTVDTSLSIVIDKGIKTFLDWNEKPCVRGDEVGYDTDRDGFFRTEVNCDLGVMRLCFNRICNCTSYALDNDDENLAPCSAMETMQCYGVLFRALNMTVPSHAYDNVSNTLINHTQQDIVQSCVHEGVQDCRRLCERRSYTYTASHLPIEQSVYKELGVQFSIPNNSGVAVVTAYYPNLRYMEIKLWRKTLPEFLSTLGGYTGIFLGASLVTSIEIFVFFFLLLQLSIRNIKKRITQPKRTTPHNTPHSTPNSPRDG